MISSTHEGVGLVSNIQPRRRPVVPESDRTGSVRFGHGLGDNVYFAHLIPLYLRRGIPIEVECAPSLRILHAAAGATILDRPAKREHAWGYPSETTFAGHGRPWQGSKLAHNISEAPLPNIGPKEQLWDEYCAVRIDVTPHLSTAVRETARRWLDQLPRPITLLHSKGTTGQQRKSLPDDVTSGFYERFIDSCPGTLLLLDWHSRVPTLAHHRVRHLSDCWSSGFSLDSDRLKPELQQGCSIELLLALYLEADLMIGVDSGPLHLTRFTSIPTIGVWMPGHYPATYTLPRSEQVNVVLADHTRQWNRYHRLPLQIVEHPGSAFDPQRLAELTRQMLSEPGGRGWSASRNPGDSEPRPEPGVSRSAPTPATPTIAQDVHLQHLVDLCHGPAAQPRGGINQYWDRQNSLRILLQETARRFSSPVIVETGTIRAEEDFAGAGFVTYIAGAFVSRHGGQLHSVDLSTANVAFARTWTAPFGDRVTIHEGDSIEFLAQFNEQIDVLYLDSLDADVPGHAEHCQREMRFALPLLHDRSLICIDDTPFASGAFVGKGAMAVPWLLAHGWRILYAGYQVVLTK